MAADGTALGFISSITEQTVHAAIWMRHYGKWIQEGRPLIQSEHIEHRHEHIERIHRVILDVETSNGKSEIVYHVDEEKDFTCLNEVSDTKACKLEFAFRRMEVCGE